MCSILKNVVALTNIYLDEYYFFENSQVNDLISSFSEEEIYFSKKINKFINCLLLTSKRKRGDNRYVGEYIITTLFKKTFTLTVIYHEDYIFLDTQGFEIKKYESYFEKDIIFYKLLKEWYSLYILRKMLCRNKKYSLDEMIVSSILL